jgi:hypothetical protein
VAAQQILYPTGGYSSVVLEKLVLQVAANFLGLFVLQDLKVFKCYDCVSDASPCLCQI